MKIKPKDIPKTHQKPTRETTAAPSLWVWLRQFFDADHRYRREVQRFLRLELDVIHREKHVAGRNLSVVQVKLLDHSTRHHRTEYVIARSLKGNWVEVQIDYDRGVRRIISVSPMHEADVRVELRDDPDAYQQHFGTVEDI